MLINLFSLCEVCVNDDSVVSTLMRNNVYSADNTDVLYNKFNFNSSTLQRPNSDYSCAVATADHWRVVRCDERHYVVCQSDHDTLPGTVYEAVYIK